MAFLKAVFVFPVILTASCVAPSGGMQVANAACDADQPSEAYAACRKAAIDGHRRELALASQTENLRTGNCLTTQALESQGESKVPISGFGTQCDYSDPYTDLFYLQKKKP